MSTLLARQSDCPPQPLAIALPGIRDSAAGISVRLATKLDFAFIDELQKKHSNAVGFLYSPEIEEHTKKGNIIIGELEGQRVGYCVSTDKYYGREEVGHIHQLNIVPGKQRKLVGAALIKAVFDRAPYGTRLYGCWCAQDLPANHFWEAIGFVPLAFRTGSRTRGKNGQPRIHIYWQRRTREGDTETPFWFPSRTNNGKIQEVRIALPIPPGTHWSDAKPAILPGLAELPQPKLIAAESNPADASKAPASRRKSQPKKPVELPRTSLRANVIRFSPLPPPPPAEEKPGGKAKAANKPPKMRQEYDPKYLAAARELRDRYMEQYNAPENRLLPEAYGKYDVSRQLEAAPTTLGALPGGQPPQQLKAA